MKTRRSAARARSCATRRRSVVTGTRSSEAGTRPRVDAEAEATRLRDAGGSAGRTALLALANAIARAYATLHTRGVSARGHPSAQPADCRAGEVCLIDFDLSGVIGERARRG